MIKLVVADYCQTCPYFHAKVEKLQDHFIVRCANSAHCKHTYDRIVEKLKEKKTNADS